VDFATSPGRQHARGNGTVIGLREIGNVFPADGYTGDGQIGFATVGNDHQLLRASRFLDLRRKVQLICGEGDLGLSGPDPIPSCHQQSGSQQPAARHKQHALESRREDHPFRRCELFQVSPSLNSRRNLKRRWSDGLRVACAFGVRAETIAVRGLGHGLALDAAVLARC